MNKGCNQFTEGLATIASGGSDAATEQHLKSCPACAQALRDLNRILERIGLAQFEPPNSVVDRAKALMPAERRVARARLLSSTLSLAGARSAVAEDRFQMVFESEGVQARLMYVQEGKAWQVVGRLSDPAWSVQRSEGDLSALAEGRFEFRADDLTATALVLLRGDTEIHVPSAEEARRGGAN